MNQRVISSAVLLLSLAGRADTPLRFEAITLTGSDPAITVHLLHRPGVVERHPVILMLGALNTNVPPAWAADLVRDGWMLCAFSAAYEPEPDPARRPQWLVFDERFAHSYPLAARRAVRDTARVIDHLQTRSDVAPAKFGWFGSSSTGIPGLAVATQGPRLAAVLTFVSTGAYRQWLDFWEPNGLWSGGANGRWPETDELLQAIDPLLRATNLWPTATLMVNGGDDKVIDPESARAFFRAAQPAFAADPQRLRLVMYEGFAHNLPEDVVKYYADYWFRLYLHPTQPPPGPAEVAKSLEEAARRTQINAQDHQRVIGAE